MMFYGMVLQRRYDKLQKITYDLEESKNTIKVQQQRIEYQQSYIEELQKQPPEGGSQSPQVSRAKAMAKELKEVNFTEGKEKLPCPVKISFE